MSIFRDNPKTYFATESGRMLLGDSRFHMKNVKSKSVDLIVTSPPFCLQSKKDYGNEDENSYLDWFRTFATDFKRVIKPKGSLVIDIGGGWKSGRPTRSLTHFKLMIMLCEEFGFKLSQEVYWFNPSKLPSPAQWVTVDRVRLKDAVNTVWWLSPSDDPKANNRNVQLPYSESMESLISRGATKQIRPSGHELSTKIGRDLGGAISSNLLTIPNTSSMDTYLRRCRESGIKPHPARFPRELPEFFIRLLTTPGDTVLDPFGGSCVVGEIAESLHRNWVCIEQQESYLKGAKLRFSDREKPTKRKKTNSFYQIPHVDSLWTYPTMDFGSNAIPSKKPKRTGSADL